VKIGKGVITVLLKSLGVLLALLLIVAAILEWPIWIPFAITAIVLIGIIFLK